MEGPACTGTREDHWKEGERSWTSFDSGVPLTQRSELSTRCSEFPGLRCELRVKRSMTGAVFEAPLEASATILEHLFQGRCKVSLFSSLRHDSLPMQEQ